MTATTTIDTGLKRRFEAGDGLRGLAALGVLLLHAGKTTTNLSHDAAFGTYFGEGGHVARGLELSVYIFFALSGYLIARPFARALVTGRRRPSVRRYARSRLLRIVPALWVVWTLTLLIDGTRGASTGQLLAVYGFAQTIEPSAASWLLIQAWTLDIEMAFYILVPVAAGLLYLLVRRLPPGRDRALWLFAGVAVVAVASMVVRVRWDNPAFKSMLPEFLVAFAPGIALAVIEPVWGEPARGSQPLRRAASLILLLGCALFLVRCLAPAGRPWAITAWGSVTGGLVVAGALMREWTGAPAFRPLVRPVVVWWGERSYGVYLVHLLLLRQLAPLIDDIGNAWLAWCVIVPLLVASSAAAAALSWRFIEKPAMNLGKRRTAPAIGIPEPAPARAT